VRWLLDTNVVSELRRGSRANAAVVEWFDDQSVQSLFLSVVTLGEIRQGIDQLRKREGRRALELDRWLTGLGQFYEDRLLFVDEPIADEWGRLRARHSVPVVDGLIAATARVHRLTVATRNVRDFSRLDVDVLNPFVT
jgi:predicted nucleic acid-binding protein